MNHPTRHRSSALTATFGANSNRSLTVTARIGAARVRSCEKIKGQESSLAKSAKSAKKIKAFFFAFFLRPWRLGEIIIFFTASQQAVARQAAWPGFAR
jgi:hypothetical protein